MKNYYETLGVKKESSFNEIKKKYRKLARKNHPDINSGSKESEKKFKEISEAYNILSNPKKRRNYDLGHDINERIKPSSGGFGFHFQHNSEEFNPFGIFDDIYEHIKKRDHEKTLLNIQIHLTLEEAFSGCEKNLKYIRIKICKKCKGKKCQSEFDIVKCDTCNGTGEIKSGNIIFSITNICPICSGSGKKIKNPCKECSGSGYNEEEIKNKVKIPKGMVDNIGIRIKNKGHQLLNKTWSDCIVRVRVVPHDIFHIERNNIFLKMPVPIHLSITGGEIEVPTLHGIKKHKIPENIGIKYNFIMKNKGFPVLNGSRYGDQYVSCLFESPKKVSTEIIEKLKTIKIDERTYPEYINVLKKFR